MTRREIRFFLIDPHIFSISSDIVYSLLFFSWSNIDIVIWIDDTLYRLLIIIR